MKKITTLVAAMLMLFMGNAWAQRGWEFNPDSIVTEIVPGEDVYYVIQQGFGPSNAKPINGFLNSGDKGVVTNLEHSCIFNFIQIGEKEANGETFPIFILKNIATDTYVTDNGARFTSSELEAFQFTARIAQAKDMQDPSIKESWYEYSNAINGEKCPGAEGVNWVFCHPESFKFMAFNNNPGWSTGYVTATNWRVYVAHEKPLSPQEKFRATFDKYYTDGVDETLYPVGTNPGCVSQELYDALQAVYTAAYNNYNETTLSDEVYNKLNQDLLDMAARVAAERVPLTAGYYCLYNRDKGFLAENGIGVCDGKMTAMPEAWSIENAKYIWKIEDIEEQAGRFYIQSAVSENYITKAEGNEYHMTVKPQTSFTANVFVGNWWNINDKALLHAKPKDGHLNNYGKAEDAGNQWQFYTVTEESFEAIHQDIIQANLNKALSQRIQEIEINLEGLKNKCGLTMNGSYANSGTGLVSAFEDANANDTHFGSDARFAFDRNVETVYQTEWSANAPAGVRHWVQLDFTEPLQDLVVKFTRRIQKNSIPTRMAFYAAEEDNLEAETWTEELYEDTVIYTYPTTFKDTIVDSTTYIQTIKLTRPAQHVRFTVTKTDNDKYWNEGGPTWCLSEMRFYKAANNKENQSFNLIPKDTINALNEMMEKAKAELAANHGTQETLDALNAAMTSVLNNYPNPSALRGSIESALYRHEVAVESETDAATDWGYYHPGAKAAYLNAINAISKELQDENKVLTLDDISRLKRQMQEAINALNAQLIVPSNGVYHLVCKAGTNPDNGEEYPEEGAYISAANADYNSPAVWAYKGDEELASRWNTLWQIEKNQDGKFSFKNLLTGLYLDNPYEGLTEEEQDTITTTTPVRFSETPKYITLEASPVAGLFMLTLKHNRFVNASGQKMVGTTGRPMAIWGDYKNGTRSRYTFETVTAEDFIDGSFKVNCAANAYQIISLPIELQGAYTATSNAYKVLGVKDSLLQLKLYEDGDIIPAGGAFILKTAEGETMFEALPTASTFDELLTVTYNRQPVVLNGLVSAPCEFQIGEGYGLFFQDKVIATAGTEIVRAGSGFFNKDIPATTVDGDIALCIKDVLTGEGTLVETVIDPTNQNKDVYTISGVKIRQNVKGAEILQGLPRGIYIVGGKKMIVK